MHEDTNESIMRRGFIRLEPSPFFLAAMRANGIDLPTPIEHLPAAPIDSPPPIGENPADRSAE